VTVKVNVGGGQQAAAPARLGPDSVPSLSQVCPKTVPSDLAQRLLAAAKLPAGIQALMECAGQTNRTRFRNSVLKPLLDRRLLEATDPARPRSSKPQYRLTRLGRSVLDPHGPT
jgi:hypothetical protein